MAKASGGGRTRAGHASRVLATVFAFAGATLLITGPGALAAGLSDTFAQATEVLAPSNAGATPPAPQAGLDGISCTSASKCTAVGTYEDSSGNGQAMEATETSGRWRQATEVTAPSSAGTDPHAVLKGISCTSAGNCTAVGEYLDSSGRFQAMAAQSPALPPMRLAPFQAAIMPEIPSSRRIGGSRSVATRRDRAERRFEYRDDLPR
jgi:hypothetical protein